MSGAWIAAFVVLWVLVLLLAVGFVGLVRLRGTAAPAHNHDHENPDDLADISPGERPAFFATTDADGAPVDFRDLAGRTLLVTSPGCPPCEQLLTTLTQVPAGSMTHLVVALHDPPTAAQRRSGARFVPDPDRLVGGAFGVGGTPVAFDLDESGAVRAVRVPRADATDLAPSPS